MSKRELIVLIAGVVVIAAAAGAYVWVLQPRLREEPERRSTLRNLQEIGDALVRYAREHDDTFPTSFAVLLKEGYLDEPRAFINPASGNDVPEDFPREDLKSADMSVLATVDDWSDYVLVTAIKRLPSRKDLKGPLGKRIKVHEKPGDADIVQCFLLDGSIKEVPKGRLEDRLKKESSEANGG